MHPLCCENCVVRAPLAVSHSWSTASSPPDAATARLKGENCTAFMALLPLVALETVVVAEVAMLCTKRSPLREPHTTCSSLESKEQHVTDPVLPENVLTTSFFFQSQSLRSLLPPVQMLVPVVEKAAHVTLSGEPLAVVGDSVSSSTPADEYTPTLPPFMATSSGCAPPLHHSMLATAESPAPAGSCIFPRSFLCPDTD
eukprot:CAMPEP_0206213698 /NCGR_PEP_ID=MMETSP0047_2-20121206/1261_1 /ASSEMBLY_ACC=CAM_ASM_000192 /TAXON_ID=195065 /ORGANISM="Chroomonas mesostigmatica_cf, Strain CCMP1168" /LENGTH=198 /DNA_ID=CAMNT_0053635865 /DNA_START=318 /DNA_END=911 /DNA_ORIENTATION=+